MPSNYAKILYMKILLTYSLICCAKIRRNNSSQKIAFGDFARIEDVPYVVRLYYDFQGFCSGAIIHKYWVLTAGHCLAKLDDYDVKVFAGIDRVHSTGIVLGVLLPEVQIRSADQLIVHPDYEKGTTNGKDIALLRVKDQFNLSPKVGILELSDDIWPQDNRYSRDCIAAGWGTYAGDVLATRLKKLELPTRHGYEGCKCYWGMNQALVCTGETQSVCPGDSGGALNCDGKGVGVASFLYWEEKTCKPVFFDSSRKIKCGDDSYAAFTYVCPHLDWINSYVPGVPKTPKSCKATHDALPSNYIMVLVLILQIKFYTL